MKRSWNESTAPVDVAAWWRGEDRGIRDAEALFLAFHVAEPTRSGPSRVLQLEPQHQATLIPARTAIRHGDDA